VVITFVALKFYKKRTTCYFNFLHDLRVTVDCFLWRVCKCDSCLTSAPGYVSSERVSKVH